MTVGSDASHVVMGNLMGADGKPLALLGGEVRAKDRAGFKPVLVFTGRAVNFVPRTPSVTPTPAPAATK